MNKDAHDHLSEEAEYFNQSLSNVDLIKIDINRAFNRDSREGQFILKHIPKNLKAKQVLDIGCGIGDTSVFFAKRGAKVVGIDISPKAIEISKKLSKLHQTNNLTKFKTGDIQKLDYKANSFDIVNGKAVLHHVDLNQAITEVHRVLKPGGIAIFSDPLDYNPIIKFYDKFASSGLRSPDERRLNLQDLSRIKAVFRKVQWIGTDITSLLVFMFFFVYLKMAGKVLPNWFEAIQRGELWLSPYRALNKVDDLLPKPIQLLGWRLVIWCQK